MALENPVEDLKLLARRVRAHRTLASASFFLLIRTQNLSVVSGKKKRLLDGNRTRCPHGTSKVLFPETLLRSVSRKAPVKPRTVLLMCPSWKVMRHCRALGALYRLFRSI
jgi:hypothetical protein